MFASVKNIHFVGIGGIGMSGIAEILLNQGFVVSGSDMAASDNTDYLKRIGCKIFIGHDAQNIVDAEVVVYSSAVRVNENPETSEALKKNIPLIRRAEMLAEVARLNYCLAISGTHGKTTTTSMVALALIKGGIDPTVLVGGRLSDFGGTNARLGKGKWTVVEADEYDRSFLQLLPAIAIVNNVEAEHLDIYKDYDDVKNTFTEFANKVPFYGFVALGLDDHGCRDILASINKKVITYGISRHADIRAINLEFHNHASSFEVVSFGENLGKIEINIPGLHNVKNALAAITVALKLNVDFETIRQALAEFKGVYRRFEQKGFSNGALVVDDYGHHPTEVIATLEAARKGWNKRIICVFQPHTYTRTKELSKEFGQAFDDADLLIITDVYAAREKAIEGITGNTIAEAAIKFGHKNVVYMPNLNDIAPYIKGIANENDLILTVGAGSIWKVAQELVS